MHLIRRGGLYVRPFGVVKFNAGRHEACPYKYKFKSKSSIVGANDYSPAILAILEKYEINKTEAIRMSEQKMSLLDRLRKVEIYLYFDQSKEEKLVILMDGENNHALAERYKPSNQDVLIIISNPVLNGGEISFKMALQI